jgi:hypothetical protein
MDFELANKLYERWKKYKNGDVCRYVLIFPLAQQWGDILNLCCLIFSDL